MNGTDSTIRTMLSEGDIRAILDTLGTDRREEFVTRSINANGSDGVVILAQLGRALIVSGEQGTQVTVHGHDKTLDDECWTGLVTGMRESVDAHNRMAEAIQADSRAQRLLALGAPEDMVAGAWEMRQRMAATAPDTDGMPPVSHPYAAAPVADAGDVTVELPGFYL